jgi:hypothetical protein
MQGDGLRVSLLEWSSSGPPTHYSWCPSASLQNVRPNVLTGASLSSNGIQFSPLDLVFIYYLVSSGVIDICISVVLLSYLLRSKAKAGFDGLNATINRLVNIIWQTALPPCICAIATAIIYIVMVGRH